MLSFLLAQAALAATPLLLAGFGELFAQRAGIINVGIEGAMLTGAIAAFSAAVLTGTPHAALPAAMAAGLLYALLFAIPTVWFRADQIVTGTALNILAVGIATTAWRMLQPHLPATEPPHYNPIAIPMLKDIPLLGPALFA